MDWVDKPQNYKDLYGILQLLRFSHLNNFQLKTLKLGWVAFHSVTFQLKCLDFQSNQYKKLVPVLSRFCNGLCKYAGKETRREWGETGKKPTTEVSFLFFKFPFLKNGKYRLDNYLPIC